MFTRFLLERARYSTHEARIMNVVLHLSLLIAACVVGVCVGMLWPDKPGDMISFAWLIKQPWFPVIAVFLIGVAVFIVSDVTVTRAQYFASSSPPQVDDGPCDPNIPVDLDLAAYAKATGPSFPEGMPDDLYHVLIAAKLHGATYRRGKNYRLLEVSPHWLAAYNVAITEAAYSALLAPHPIGEGRYRLVLTDAGERALAAERARRLGFTTVLPTSTQPLTAAPAAQQ